MNWTELPCEQPHWNACVQNWLSTNRPTFAAANQVLNQWTRRVTGLTCYRSVQFSSVRARWSSLPNSVPVTASFHAISLYITRPLVISVSRPSSSPKCRLHFCRQYRSVLLSNTPVIFSSSFFLPTLVFARLHAVHVFRRISQPLHFLQLQQAAILFGEGSCY